ncbi:MAG: hypothetical protein ACYTEQ_11015, partial [Planctomycetota bacterium]
MLLKLGLIRLWHRLRRDKLGLTGFVFREAESGFIFISLCGKAVCGRFGHKGIGFVLHKNKVVFTG